MFELRWSDEAWLSEQKFCRLADAIKYYASNLMAEEGNVHIYHGDRLMATFWGNGGIGGMLAPERGAAAGVQITGENYHEQG